MYVIRTTFNICSCCHYYASMFSESIFQGRPMKGYLSYVMLYPVHVVINIILSRFYVQYYVLYSGILVFFPSYYAMENISTRWRNIGTS